MSYQRISIEDTKELIKDDDITIIDIRDFNSFSYGHIQNAIHIEDLNIENFIQEKDKNKPILIYCYHGNSSKTAANFFYQNGFQQVYSMDEGYEGWLQSDANP
jgi:thiosulfate sulfurtransferase